MGCIVRLPWLVVHRGNFWSCYDSGNCQRNTPQSQADQRCNLGS